MMTSTGPPYEPPSDQPPPPTAGAPWPPPPYSYPSPPQPPPQWGPPPWVPPPVPPRRTAVWVIPVVIVGVLVVCGCLSAVGLTVMRTPERAGPPTPARAGGVAPSVPGSLEEEPEAEATGPRASSYPVREDDDLSRVCDGYYYPQSPKFAGRAPHPIAVGVIDRKDLPSRTVKSSVDVPYSLDQKIWKAWRPDGGSRTQLMVCVDLAGTGKQVRKCAYEDPELKQVPLIRATYRVRLYEVATGRKLVDRRMTGNDDECPMFVLLGADRRIYTNVADRDLYETFRSYVMKK